MNESSSSSFHTTRWTLVRNAAGFTPEARQALSELCAAYYAPVVAFLRRERLDEDMARELAHEFFAKLLAGDTLGNVEPGRGRFRSYLLGAVKHFLANRRRDAEREKRGGQIEHSPLEDHPDASPEPPPSDAAFDREWAQALVDRALEAVARESPRPEQFEALKPWLTPAGSPVSQAETAANLGMSEGALKVAIHRLRRRFRELVRAEVRQTLLDPEELEDEMRHLVEALA